MNIVFVNPYFPPCSAMGGVEKEFINLGHEYKKQGHNIAIVTTNFTYRKGVCRKFKEIYTEFDIIRLRGFFRCPLLWLQRSNAPWFIPGLAKTIIGLKPDVVFFFNGGWPISIRKTLKKLAQEKIPVIYRTYYHPFEKNNFISDVVNRFTLQTMAIARNISVASKFEKKMLVKYGVPGSKISILLPGLNKFDIKRKEIEEFRQKYGLTGKKIIVHVARLCVGKGTDKLLEILPNLKNKIKNIHLLLVGKNKDAELLYNLIEKLDLKDNVTFLEEWIPDERELAKIYSASDIFVLPSRYEALGFVFLEAMSNGIPVVGTRVGGIPSIVDNNKNGFLVPLDRKDKLEESIIKLLENRNIYKKMSIGAKKLKCYTWKEYADKCLSLLKSKNSGGILGCSEMSTFPT